MKITECSEMFYCGCFGCCRRWRKADICWAPYSRNAVGCLQEKDCRWGKTFPGWIPGTNHICFVSLCICCLLNTTMGTTLVVWELFRMVRKRVMLMLDYVFGSPHSPQLCICLCPYMIHSVDQNMCFTSIGLSGWGIYYAIEGPHIDNTSVFVWESVVHL